MERKKAQYWIGVVSREHVRRGVKGGFIQLNHGKRAPLRRMQAGDGIAMYSPRVSYPEGEVLQAFTALGTVRTGEIYQVKMTPDFEPFRIKVDFVKSAKETPIRPLLPALSLIKNKQSWGAAFRFGYVRIPKKDFDVIAKAMSSTPARKGR